MTHFQIGHNNKAKYKTTKQNTEQQGKIQNKKTKYKTTKQNTEQQGKLHNNKATYTENNTQ